MGTTRFKRLLEMISYIRSNANVSIFDIMNEFEISRSTAFRDLKILVDCGVPCSYDPIIGYTISSSYMLPVNNITTTDGIALAKLVTRLKTDAGDTSQKNASRALQKLLATLPKTIRDIFQHPAQNNISILGSKVDESNLSKQRVSMILDAIHKRIPISSELILGDKSRTEVRIHPYHLMLNTSRWYLWGKVFPQSKLMSIEVDSLIHPVMLNNRFHAPDDKVRVAWNKAWRVKPEGNVYLVELEVKDNAVNDFVAKSWHCTQKLGVNKKGRMVMSFKVDGLDEIAQWVWQHYQYLTVINPIDLKRLLKKQASQLLCDLDL